MSREDQQFKCNIKNVKNCLCIFVVLVLTKSMSETSFNQTVALC